MTDPEKEPTGGENGALLPPSDPPAPAKDKTVEKLREDNDTSDNDTGERPVREKLKKTSLAGLPKNLVPATGPEDANSHTNASMDTQSGAPAVVNSEAGAFAAEPRGRPPRKRSFEDLQSDDCAADKGAEATDSPSNSDKLHKRMRSRDVNSKPNSSIDDTIAKDQATSAPTLPFASGENKTKTALGPSSSTPPPSENVRMDEAAQPVLSPKKKRSRDQFDKDHGDLAAGSDESRERSIGSGSEEIEGEDLTKSTSLRDTKGEPEKKRHRDLSQGRKRSPGTEPTTTKAKLSGGLGNTSTTSPFGNLASTKSPFGSKKPEISAAEDGDRGRTTSPSAFASSGLSAFASSDKSPFGALATPSSSGFGALGSTSAQTSVTPGFGNTLGSTLGASKSQSISSGSGFGRLGGSAFGGPLGSGFGAGGNVKGITSFAAPGGSGIIGVSGASTKAFGAPADEEADEGDGEGSGESDGETPDEQHKDRRFVEQEIETGEEGEDTIFSCRAKLFHFDGHEWRERGIGTFKVNVTELYPESKNERKARLIMRTDGVHRVVLNTPVFKGMKFGNNEGKEPAGKMINLAGMEKGRPVPLLLKTGSADVAKDLYHKIDELKEDL